MALAARSQPAAVNFLNVWFEECTISYYADGSRDVLGAPARTLTQRDTNVLCDIQPLNSSPTFTNQAGSADTQKQGIVVASTHWLFVLASQTIEPNDVVEDVDGDTYDVEAVSKLHTHTEAFMVKRN